MAITNSPTVSNQRLRGQFNKNGGTPGSARHEVLNMEAVAELAAPLKAPRITPSAKSPDWNAALWLKGEVEKAQKCVTTQIVDLTPPLARVLLARNEKNRKMSPVMVESYARDMTNGAWAFNGEPIIVAKDGKLNDGQHRCEAVVVSGITIPVVMVIGPERDTRLTVDQGRTRLAGDYLGMEGFTDANALASVAKWIWQHSNFGRISRSSSMAPTKGEVLGLVESTPTIVESAKRIQNQNSNVLGGRTVLIFLHWTFTRTSGGHTAPDAFFEGLFSGTNLPMRSPILYARNRLMAERGRLKVGDRAELIIRAWNAWRRGDKITSIPIKGGALPMVER